MPPWDSHCSSRTNCWDDQRKKEWGLLLTSKCLGQGQILVWINGKISREAQRSPLWRVQKQPSLALACTKGGSLRGNLQSTLENVNNALRDRNPNSQHFLFRQQTSSFNYKEQKLLSAAGKCVYHNKTNWKVAIGRCQASIQTESSVLKASLTHSSKDITEVMLGDFPYNPE